MTNKTEPKPYTPKQAEGDYEIQVHDNGKGYEFTLVQENGGLMSLNWRDMAEVQIEGYVRRKLERGESIPYDVANAIVEEGYVNERGMLAIQPLIDHVVDSHGRLRQSQHGYMTKSVDDAIDSWKEVTPAPAVSGLEARFGEKSKHA